MATNPRGILVVHNDESAAVSQCVTRYLKSQDMPVLRRNIRYGFNPNMYYKVIVVGTKKATISSNTLFFEYVPYYRYCKLMEGSSMLEQRAYYIEKAKDIALRTIEHLKSIAQ